MLLTEAQQNYVAQYCAKIREVLEDLKPGDFSRSSITISSVRRAYLCVVTIEA